MEGIMYLHVFPAMTLCLGTFLRRSQDAGERITPE